MPTVGNETGDTNCQIGVGSTGPGVKALQNTLNDCYGTRLVVDGIYGNQTSSAVVHAQQANGITSDGIYGHQTRDHLVWHDDRGRCVRP